MRPKVHPMSQQQDLLRPRIEDIDHSGHPLVILAAKGPAQNNLNN